MDFQLFYTGEAVVKGVKDGSIKINLDIGDVLIFCGENVHRGFPISSGTRYILTGFINYKGHDFCSKLIKQI